LRENSKQATSIISVRSDTSFAGDKTQNCGGGMRLNMVVYIPLPEGESELEPGDGELENAEVVMLNGKLVV
jgi:hypothetical protein